MKRLEGKVAAITGGASGIGAATVRGFVGGGRQGPGRRSRPGQGRALADELGPATAFLRTDVSKEEDVAAMIAETTDRFARIDVLFNNAGFGGALGPIESTTVADYDLTMDVLLKSVFLGIEARSAVDEGPAVRLDHLDCQRGRAPRRLRATPVQRRQERGHPPDQDSRAGARRARRAGQCHLPRVHRDPAGRRPPRRRREPD